MWINFLCFFMFLVQCSRAGGKHMVPIFYSHSCHARQKIYRICISHLLYLQLLHIQWLQIINNAQDLCRCLKLSYIDTVFFGIKQDTQNNRIGQWKNISSTRWILQLSHELNPEARQGIYKLIAYIGDRAISHYFEVKKYGKWQYHRTFLHH